MEKDKLVLGFLCPINCSGSSQAEPREEEEEEEEEVEEDEGGRREGER